MMKTTPTAQQREGNGGHTMTESDQTKDDTTMLQNLRLYDTAVITEIVHHRSTV